MSRHLPYFDLPGGGTGPFAAGPIALAHRGYPSDGLENTTAAFRAAVALGVGHLETDVRCTRDGTVVLFHDDILDRVTDGRGRVRELTAAQLAGVRVHGSEPIPLLEDVLAAFPEVRLNLDIKERHAVQALAAVIERHGAHERVLIASFSDHRRRAVLRLLSRRTASSAGIAGTVLFAVPGPLLPVKLLRRILHDVDCLQVPAAVGPVPLVTRGFVRRAHRLGLQVHVWTVNEPGEMGRLLDLGVDGIVTDRPDLLKTVLQGRREA